MITTTNETVPKASERDMAKEMIYCAAFIIVFICSMAVLFYGVATSLNR